MLQVQDIYCNCCDLYLGWKYEEAFEQSQKVLRAMQSFWHEQDMAMLRATALSNKSHDKSSLSASPPSLLS